MNIKIKKKWSTSKKKRVKHKLKMQSHIINKFQYFIDLQNLVVYSENRYHARLIINE